MSTKQSSTYLVFSKAPLI